MPDDVILKADLDSKQEYRRGGDRDLSHADKRLYWPRDCTVDTQQASHFLEALGAKDV